MAEEPRQAAATNVWDVVRAFIVVAGFVFLLVFLTLQTISIMKDKSAQAGASFAVNVLAVVIPAVATIGAAAFGVTVAYQSGRQTSAAKGETAAAKGDAATQKARAEDASRRASEFKTQRDGLVERVRTSVADLRERLNTEIVPQLTALPSPPGENVFRLTQGETAPVTLEVKGDSLATVRDCLVELQAHADAVATD
jgi:heme/copper-type cytochrome/quinol oxidase subunit 2